VPIVEQDRIHLTKVTLGSANGQSVEITSGIPAGVLIAVNDGDDGVEEDDRVQSVVTQAFQIEHRTGESSPRRTK